MGFFFFLICVAAACVYVLWIVYLIGVECLVRVTFFFFRFTVALLLFYIKALIEVGGL